MKKSSAIPFIIVGIMALLLGISALEKDDFENNVGNKASEYIHQTPEGRNINAYHASRTNPRNSYINFHVAEKQLLKISWDSTIGREENWH